MKIRDARSLPSVTQESLRRRAVQAVQECKTQVEVARMFAVTRRAIGKWVKTYREDGEKALQSKKKGRPKGGSLLSQQAAHIVRLIVDHCPDQLRLPFALWTREAVGQLIKQKFGIQLSKWTVGRYLAEWGFTPQKPTRQAYEQNPKEVRRWLKKKYPAIRQQAKREKAEIYWGDEMGLRSDHAVGRSYGRRGKTPVIPGMGQRFGCNMISAITNRGHLNFMVFKARFRTDVFLKFLKRLVRQANRKVFLIVDRHPVHLAKKVQVWLRKNPHRIRVFFLPGYSPELNPDELLNQDVKSNAVGRCRPRNQAELVTIVRGYLRSCQRRPHKVKQYFQKENVRYAAI